jgi:Uma2 family endonuclease
VALPVPEREPVDYRSMAELLKDQVPGLSVEEAFDMFSAVAPKGWRVELIEGEIHVTPPANGEHEEIVSEVTDQVVQRRKEQRIRSYTGIGLFLPGASVSGKVEPDIVLAPKGSFDDQAEYHDCSAVLLVVDVAGNDRVKKISGYVRAGIPVYLLIDRESEQAVVCTEPSGEDYGAKAAYKLGEVVPLPDPLGFDLDTGRF